MPAVGGWQLMKRKVLASVCIVIVTPRGQRAPAIPALPASGFWPRLRSKAARRCVTGGALLLGQALTVAPAGAKPREGATTRVSDPARPQRSDASLVRLAVSVAAGPSFARGKARYDSSDLFGEPSAPSFDSHSTVAPGSALTFTLGGRVGSRLLVGGAIMIRLATLPNRFTGDTKAQSAFGVGPELALLPDPRGGVFAYARGGIGTLNAWAWSAAMGAGYALPLGKTALVGLGLELSGVYSRFEEDGDFGTYTYKDEILAPALLVRLMP